MGTRRVRQVNNTHPQAHLTLAHNSKHFMASRMENGLLSTHPASIKSCNPHWQVPQTNTTVTAHVDATGYGLSSKARCQADIKTY